MKRTFLLINILGAFAFTLKGQSYIFNNCSDQPVYGDSLTGIDTHYDTTGITLGNTGANVTWTYSITPVATSNILHHYYDPAVYDSSSNFPGATLADADLNGNYSFYQYGPDSITYLGDSLSPSFNHYYWDPKKQISCPFIFGNSFSEFNSSYTPLSVCPCHHTYINRTVSYDAYGTLILPAATYPLTARIKEVEDILDTTVCFPISVWNTRKIFYTWYDAASGMKVFSIWYFIDSVNSYTNKFVDSYDYTHLPVTVAAGIQSFNNQGSGLHVYPNPSDGMFTLTMDEGPGIEGTLTVCNVLGKTIYRQPSCRIPPSGAISLQLAVPAGIYFLRIDSGNQMMTKKIVIE